MAETTETTERRADIIAAALIGGAALITLVAVMHHPVLGVGHEAGAGKVIAAMARVAATDRLVHGGLMLLLGLETVGFVHFTRRLGMGRPAAVAGLVFFAASSLLMVIPAGFDGFVVPALGARCAEAAGGCAGSLFDMLGLVSTVIQAFTRLALAGQAVAVLCWGLGLLLSGGGLRRMAGAAGLVLGAAPLAMLLASAEAINPHSLLLLMLSQVVWNLLAAVLLIGASLDVRKVRDPGETC